MWSPMTMTEPQSRVGCSTDWATQAPLFILILNIRTLSQHSGSWRLPEHTDLVHALSLTEFPPKFWVLLILYAKGGMHTLHVSPLLTCHPHCSCGPALPKSKEKTIKNINVAIAALWTKCRTLLQMLCDWADWMPKKPAPGNQQKRLHDCQG